MSEEDSEGLGGGGGDHEIEESEREIDNLE